MAAGKQTKSEQLFEEICRVSSVECRRLAELADGQQPDYEIKLTGQTVVVEVKQVDPNPSDEAFRKQLRSNVFSMQNRSLDAMARRIRNFIGTSRGQLNAYLEKSPRTPALLVVYDSANNFYTDPYTILVAMHGSQQATFAMPAVGRPPFIKDVGFGPRNNRELRPEKNTHLSALVTLHERYELSAPHKRFLELCFYHNPFAACPVHPSLWSGKNISHLAISQKTPGQFENWIPIGTSGRD